MGKADRGDLATRSAVDVHAGPGQRGDRTILVGQLQVGATSLGNPADGIRRISRYPIECGNHLLRAFLVHGDPYQCVDAAVANLHVVTPGGRFQSFDGRGTAGNQFLKRGVANSKSVAAEFFDCIGNALCVSRFLRLRSCR